MRIITCPPIVEVAIVIGPDTTHERQRRISVRLLIMAQGIDYLEDKMATNRDINPRRIAKSQIIPPIRRRGSVLLISFY